MASKIEQLRKQYPQYDDMSDDDFAKAFHKNFYSDLEYDDFAKRLGVKSAITPSGTELVETYGDGGRIVKNIKTGKESYVSDAFATSDPVRIAEIRAAEGKAGEVSRIGFAQDIIDQAGKFKIGNLNVNLGEIPARAASAIKGVPFIGSYADEAIGALFGQDAASATRAAQEAREIVAPKTVMASRGAVGLATAVPAALAAPSMALAPLGTSLTSRMIAGAGLGAAGGALEGAIYGSGEGRTARERKDQAISGGKVGAAFGGILGPALPAAGAAIGALRGSRVAAPARATQRELGIKDQATDLLSSAAQMDEPMAAANMARAGQYGSLGMMGPSTKNLLDLAAASTSEGAARARQNIEELAGDAGRQFDELLDTTFGGPEAALKLQDNLMSSTAGVRSDAYDEAYEQAIDYASPNGIELDNLLKRVKPSVLKNAEDLMRMEGIERPQIFAKLDKNGNIKSFERKPNVMQIDYVTRALNNVSPTAAPEDKNAARNLASKIRKSLDNQIPEYEVARATAGDVISIREAIDLGTNVFTKKVTRYDLEKAFSDMGGAEKRGLRQGVRSYIDELMANAKASLTDPNQDARELIAPIKNLMSRSSREKIETILGKDAAKEFNRQLDEVYSVMNMRAGVAQQTKTAVRQMAKETAEDATDPSLLGLMGDRGLTGGIAEKFRRQLGDQPSKNEQFRALMGEIAEPLTRQADLTTLTRQMEELRRAAPQLQRADDIYETGKSLGTLGATSLTPAMQSLLGYR